MLKTLAFSLTLAAFAVANSQTSTADSATQAAPIVRAYAGAQNSGPDGLPHAGMANPQMTPQYARQPRRIIDSQPISGVWLRNDLAGAVQTISANGKTAEFRLERGRLNANVHHPGDHTEILVDLPGGKVSILKDGLYTFNADTNTVRVLHGEAAVYPGALNSTGSANFTGKPLKVKEGHELAFTPGPKGVRSVEAYPFELTSDLLPLDRDRRGGDGYVGQDFPPYGYGFYGYPYYAGVWGYPYGWGYGYPYGYGIGFGYYGRFGGGFHGFRR